MKHIHFLIKPASSLCNLRCRYCFYEDEAENRTVKSMGLMDQKTVDALLDAAFSEIEPRGSISFAFQGGEPTVAGLPFFREFVAKARNRCPADVRLEFSIQTNGILMDEDWAEFLKEEDFLVGISLDGTRELHNRNRVDAAGGETWKKVRYSAQLLLNRGVRTNVLCVVTGQCAKHPDKVYQELKKVGFRFIQFIACLDPMDVPRGSMDYSLTPESYGKFLCRIFDLWYQDWERGNYHSVRLLEDYLHILLGDGGSTCATCGRCGGYFVVEGDGSVYPCDFFVLDRWRVGKLGEQSLSQMRQGEVFREFLEWGREKPAQCGSCRWRQICNGGCKNDWESIDGVPRNHYCKAFQMLFDHGAQRLIHMARSEQNARRRLRG